MLLVDQDRLGEAESSLKAILYPTSQRLSPLGETMRNCIACHQTYRLVVE